MCAAVSLAVSLRICGHEDGHILLLVHLCVVQLYFFIRTKIAGHDSNIINCRGRIEALIRMEEVGLPLSRHCRRALAVDRLKFVVMQIILQVKVLVRI
jgi:hypothetical protein